MKWIFMACVVSLSGSAMATTWQPASVSSNGALWYVDADSIQTVSDGYNQNATKALIKVDWSAVKSEVARESKTLYFFKCGEEKAKPISTVRYAANGDVLTSYQFPYPTYSPVVPESVLSDAMGIVCKAS